MTSSPVVISKYDPDWPLHFQEIARPILEAMIELEVTLEHVGSTSVPGLAAKPIIDLDVVVVSPDHVPIAIERLRSLGYVHEGDGGIEGRQAFMCPRGARPHHLYVVVEGSQPHRDHVVLRDYLRSHPEVADEYGALKAKLAAHHGTDRVAYTEAKSEFIARVLRAAGA